MIRAGLAGCGAVAQIYYRPALRQLEDEGKVSLVGVFDPDVAAGSSMAAGFAGAQPCVTFEDLLSRNLDLLVVASPPQFHADQAIAALARGIAVHCEKPLAVSSEQGARVVAESERTGVPVSLGMVRRQLAPVRMIHGLLERGAIGALQAVEIFEGGPFHWPVSSPAYFDRHRGAAGVLEDVGTHVLDLLNWWLGPAGDVEYADDAMGGVAANCRLALAYGDSQATIRLSRDWYRPNHWLLRGSEGWIRWDLDDWQGLELETGGIPARLLARDEEACAITFEQGFAEQLRDFAHFLRGGGSHVSGAEALPVLSLLERCAAVRTQMPMPWLQ
jgi:predicted dehydrogenase